MLECPVCHRRLARDATFCPSCGSTVDDVATVPPKVTTEMLDLLARGRRLDAVKLYQKHTGASLIAAKDAIERLQSGRGTRKPETADAALEGEILEFLKRGEKVKAVKRYKERTGVGLREARTAVMAMGARHGLVLESSGCGAVSVLLLFGLLMALAAVAAAILFNS